MKSGKIQISVLLCVVVLFSALKLWASDPVGIYAIVERVVFEPNENAPERIQIWGVFALTDGQRGDGYQNPQRGYLYYTITPGKEAIARKEWADLKAVAGTGQGIGFGFRYDTKTRIRKAADRVESPDTYPTGVGVTRMGNNFDQPKVILGLKEALRHR